MSQVNLSLQDITDARFRAVCEKFLEGMDMLQVPGVALGILCDGIEYTAGLGVTRLDYPLPVTSNTLFEIGSSTKTYTGVAVMRLVEQGKLDLDAPLCAYLPGLRFADPQVTEHLTLRHLLTHTGGFLGDHFQEFGWGDDAIARYVASLSEVPQISPLGEVFSYCNSGFILAGRVIEAVTGQTYEAAIRELILEPLGLKNTFFFPSEMMHRPFAIGHHNAEKPIPAETWPVPRMAAPAGGLISTVHDQLAYARFLMGDGSASHGARLLQPETLDLMRTPQVRAGCGTAESVGLSLMVRDYAGERILFHGGSVNGQQSDFQTLPARQFAFTSLTNADNGVMLNLLLSPVIYETFLGIKAPEPTYLQLSPERLAEYTGAYTRPDGTTFTVTTGDEGQVIISIASPPDPQAAGQPEPEVYVTRFIAEDRAVITNPGLAGMLCDFARDREGRVRWVRESGRIAARVG